MEKRIYNLEFPSYCQELSVFGYRFVRAQNYKEKFLKLYHVGNSFSEFNITSSFGRHAITAIAELPEIEHNAVLPWEGVSTALRDVLFLLSIFTKRDVFPQAEDEIIYMHSDPRMYTGGGALRVSIPYEAKKAENGEEFDIGFENGLNKVYEVIRSDDWQTTYSGGHYLFLARMAFKTHFLETAYLQCWTIWEHLFSIFNERWMSPEQIRNLAAIDKISFILVHYQMLEIVSKGDRDRLARLAEIRNRLVHFGKFPEKGGVAADALMFVRLTELIITKSLNLSPNDVLDTRKHFEDFLRKDIFKQ